MILFDRAGQIVLANEHAERLFGYEPDTLRGQSLDVRCLSDSAGIIGTTTPFIVRIQTAP